MRQRRSRPVRRLGLGVSVALSAGFVSGSPHVSLHPAVVTLGTRSHVIVERWRGAQLEVELAGATDRNGRLLGWRHARRRGRSWVAELSPPALRGIYPVLLRERPGRPAIRSGRLLRVFRRNAAGEPSFATPRQAVRWWVRTRTHERVAALRRWSLPAYDLRDRRLHRLFVVAYNQPGRPGGAHTLGMFVTVVRDGYDGRWRLLDTSVAP